MAKPLRLPGIEEQRVLHELQIHLLLESGQQDRWNQWVVEQHYLHTATLVGEQLRYAVSYQSQWLALLGWSAAAWHLAPRDAWLNWSEDQRRRRLPFLAQNSRFLILADRTQFPNLGTRLPEAVPGSALGGLAGAARASDFGPGKFRGWPAFSRHDLQGLQLDDAGADRGFWPGGGRFLCARTSGPNNCGLHPQARVAVGAGAARPAARL